MSSPIPFAADRTDVDSVRFQFPAGRDQRMKVVGTQWGRFGSRSQDVDRPLRVSISFPEFTQQNGQREWLTATVAHELWHALGLTSRNVNNTSSPSLWRWFDEAAATLSEDAVAPALRKLKASGIQSHVLETFVGRVVAFDGDKAIVKLRNQSEGDWSEAVCDGEVLSEKEIGSGEEFTCEVVRENGETKVRFAKLAPRKISEEKAEEIRQRFAGRWES